MSEFKDSTPNGVALRRFGHPSTPSQSKPSGGEVLKPFMELGIFTDQGALTQLGWKMLTEGSLDITLKIST